MGSPYIAINLTQINYPKTIVLQKYKSYGTCPITGEISSQNIKLADGKLTLSPEGAKQLLAELEQYKVTV